MTTAIPLDRRDIWHRFLLYPGHTLPTAAAPLVVAAGLAAHDGVFAAGPLAAAFVASWLIHLAGVLMDNLVLVTKHADIPEHPELLRAIETGALTLRALRGAIVACLVAALALAPFLASVVGWPAVLLVGALGTAASLGYSAGPLPYTRVGITDTVFFSMFAFVAIPAAYAVQAMASDSDLAPRLLDVWHHVPSHAYVIGLPIGALVTNVLLIDEIRDVDHDRKKGWRTGAVFGGRDWARGEIVFLTIVAYAAPMWFWLGLGYGPLVLLPLVTLPYAYRVAARVIGSSRFEDLFPMTPAAARLSLLYAVALALGLMVG